MHSFTEEQLYNIFSKQPKDASLTSYKGKLDKRAEEILQSTALAGYVRQVCETADCLRKTRIAALPFSVYAMFKRSGNRIIFEELYFSRRKRLCAFAIMSWLYGRDEDISQLEDIIWAICDEYSWALPAHIDHWGENADPYHKIDLFCAETAFYLAEIIFMLGDKLDSAVVRRARQEVFSRVLDQIIEGEQYYDWENMRNNWCAVCAGSVGAAAIYMIESEEVLAKVLARLTRSFNSYMESFEDDGACTEGLSYWNYGMAFYVAFMQLLCERTAGEITLPKSEKFLRVARFQQNMFLGGDCTVSFSDSTKNEKFRLGITCMLASSCNGVIMPSRERAMDFHSDTCYRFAPILRDFLWGEPCLLQLEEKAQACNIQNSPVKNGITLYENAQWLICRNEGGLGLCAKGGHNDEPHNHNDIGSFAICKNGVFLLSDLGSGEYTAQYFGSGRYDIFCNSSYSHSVPIINGKAQLHGRGYAAKDTVLDSLGGISLDIAPAYGITSLKSLRRVISAAPDGKSVEISDSFSFSESGHNVIERFVTEFEPQVLDGHVEISGKGANARLYYNRKLMPSIGIHNHYDHKGRLVMIYTIDFPLTLDSANETLKFTIK